MESKNGPYKYSGVIVSVGERQEFGTNGFAKREFMVSPDPDAEYPSFLQFQLKTGKKEDKTSLVQPQDVGSKVDVTFYVETRKWESKKTGKSGFTTDVTAFKVEFPDGRGDVPPPAEPEPDGDPAGDEEFPF